VLKPAGFENGQGIVTAAYLKDPTDKQWDNSDDMKAWRVWMAKYNPSASLADGFNVYAYAASYTLHKTLEQCGNELTRANLMKQAANLKKLTVPLLLPGIAVNTSPTDFYPIQSERLQRFQGETWELFGDVMSNEST
jgi:branched-chain amino acid transport system substrate-binding protein